MAFARMMGLALALCMASAAAAESAPPKPLFATGDVLHITLRAPLGALIDGGSKVVTGTLAVDAAPDQPLSVSLATRGITRRNREVCSFPPLRVTFTQKPGTASVFQGQKVLKLVTHCQPEQIFEQYVRLEYAAYTLYRSLTPTSFQVRLAEVTYQDAQGRRIVSKPGFFIEDTDAMAKRNGLHEYKTVGRPPRNRMSPADAARYAVFQYMIGNLDWAMNAGPAGSQCCHNSKLIGAEDGSGLLVPVPYDFDYAGLVDAPYASPPEGIRLANVRVRRYRGFCIHNAEAKAMAASLVSRRGELLGIVGAVPGLSNYLRGKATSYLGAFFDQIGTERDVDAKLLSTCL